MRKRKSRFGIAWGAWGLLACAAALIAPVHAAAADASDRPQTAKAYPADPAAGIEWSAGKDGVSDIQSAFNNGRRAENEQLGSAIPMMEMPAQGQWDAMTDSEKGLWLINRERIDRNIHPLGGIEKNVIAVSQNYAQYLINNDAFSHEADGRTPWERLNANPAIGACHDFLETGDNLKAFWTNGESVPLPVERSIYGWIYDDANSSWGHRHTTLWHPFNENGGPEGEEGFLGIGRAGGPHNGYATGVIVVMNMFDPCASWDYASGTRGDQGRGPHGPLQGPG